jgi:hypothetical protein
MPIRKMLSKGRRISPWTLEKFKAPVPTCDVYDPFIDRMGKIVEPSLHTSAAVKAYKCKDREQLCVTSAIWRIGTAIGTHRQCNVRYQLKTPCKGGTIHVIFELLGFITPLASLIPKPRINLMHFHGVFALNSKHRSDSEPIANPRRPPIVKVLVEITHMSGSNQTIFKISAVVRLFIVLLFF